MIQKRRPLWLWAFSLWVAALGAIGLWRGVILWQERRLLFELGSALSPAALTGFVLVSILCGSGLLASGVGLWLRRAWAQWSARICIPLYVVAFQGYTWLTVRSGLMWERRWVSLTGALVALIVGVGALTWHRSRAWLGLS